MGGRNLYDDFWNRKYDLVITEKGRTIFHCNELDIKFEVERLLSTHICESKISILGIGRETINSIAKVAREVFMKAAEMEVEVNLSAGYEGRVSSIFRGFVINAHVDTPPDMWLHLTCVNYCDVGTKVISTSFCHTFEDRMTYVDLATSVAKDCGFDGVDTSLYSQPVVAKSEIVSSPFVCIGTRQKILGELSKVHSDKWNLAVDMNMLKIMDKNPEYNGDAITIDSGSGLIAATGVDFIGCYVTTFLQDFPFSNLWFRVVSKNNIGANDVFALLSKKFVGHYRGDKWYTILELYLRGQRK